jgi:predicted DNA-binding transcriptional regulator AlpA
MTQPGHPLLLRLKDLPSYVGLAERTIRKMRSQGLFPEPLWVGSTPVWSYAGLEAWVRAGCPPCNSDD